MSGSPCVTIDGVDSSKDVEEMLISMVMVKVDAVRVYGHEGREDVYDSCGVLRKDKG